MRGFGAIARWRGCRRGTAAVEFALIFPIMLLMAGGIVEFGSIFKAYNGANRLAAQYAIAWSDCSDFPAGTCLTELATYGTTASISNVVPQLVSGNVTLQMFQVQMSGTTPTVVYAYPTGATLSSGQTSAAQAAFSSGQSGVVITVRYQHALTFFTNLMGPILNSQLNPSYTVTQLKS